MTAAGVPPAFKHKAFTCRFPQGRSPVLFSDVEIFPAFLPTDNPPKSLKCRALYDTGATHSAISPRLVADLQLASIGSTNVGVGGGTLTTTSHLINIGLPNMVMFPMVFLAGGCALAGRWKSDGWEAAAGGMVGPVTAG